MAASQQPATFVPVDGRLTSLEVLNISLTGSEVMEIVSPGNAEFGNNFQVTTAVLGAYFASFQFQGATVVKVSPYIMLTTNTRLLVDLTTPGPCSILVPLAADMLAPFPVLIKDLAGIADPDTNPITITFTDGEQIDGLDQLQITNPYGWVTINPTPGGGSWYQS